MKNLIYLASPFFAGMIATADPAKSADISDKTDTGWEMHQIYLGAKLCNGLDGADVNGDGHPDYVTNFEDNGNIVLMFHPGKGNLKSDWETRIIGNFPTAESVCFGDVDGDGHPDAIVAHGNQRESDQSGLSIIWNPGVDKVKDPKAWISSVDLDGSVEIGNYLYVRTFDVNNDGALDIVAGGRAEGVTKAPITPETPIVGLVWCEAPLNPADRRDPSKWKTHDIDSDIISGHGFDFGDFDNDGDIDIALANNDWGLEKMKDTRNAVQWYENPGNGTCREEWKRHVLYVDPNFYTKPFVAVGDLNQDGALDFVTQTSDHVVYFENNPQRLGNFTTVMIPKDPKARWRARPIKLHDINQDGKPDIIIGLIHHDGNLPSEVPAIIWMEYGGDIPAANNWTTHVIKWGDGFDGKHIFTGEKWDILTFSDVDGDGDLDIVANCEEYKKINVVWFENRRK